jgi:hypothetical protein
MSKSTIGRRALVAGVATAAAAIPSVSGLPADAAAADPIYAAIERHKAAYRLAMVAGRVRSNTVDAKWSPDYDAVECRRVQEADLEATHASDTAARALTTIRPTTMAGVLALICYVQEFNAGAVFLEPDPSVDESEVEWRSAPMFWPESNDDEIDLFGYAILANVRLALEAMAVRS